MPSTPAPASKEKLYNVNVGVLGHVDSGKTCLVAALSTRLSTAALDKHPQSKERGITLDLGFSAFVTDLPPQLQGGEYTGLQVTLVDCPGHASLIRTIIGGAQIIDMMLLVIDITKGIQAQTAECLVVGEIAVDRIAVVLNKCDLVPPEQAQRTIAGATAVVRRTLAATRFGSCPIVAASARPGGGDAYKPLETYAQGLDAVCAELLRMVPSTPRALGPTFLFSIDHCFTIRGQGTVFTGTVLQGRMKVGDTIEVPGLKAQRKVKSIQMFRTAVGSCQQGDRAGIGVTKFDADSLERGLACTPGTVPTFSVAIAAVEKIRFHPGEVASRAKLHVSVGHSTVMAEATFFGEPDGQATLPSLTPTASITDPAPFDFGRDYLYQDCLYDLRGRPLKTPSSGQSKAAGPHRGRQWALLTFQQPVTAPKDALVIGSRLDADAGAQMCRLALAGRLVALLEPGPQPLAKLRVYKVKQREGTIKRVEAGGQSAICQGMFKRETDLTAFTGMKVVSQRGEVGTIEGTFGKTGRFRVAFPGGLQSVPQTEERQITLSFKKYIFDPGRQRMVQ